MKKSVGSQIIGAQMVSASDGSAFSGAVTVYVTGDGGTQAAGSVGSGACTHEGNGFHTYAPAQAETNYDHVAFTFVGSGAVPCTVQVYPTFPQTGDSFARLGAPAGASIAADIATVDDFLDTEVAAIKAKTDNLPADPADASDIAGSFSTVNSTLSTIAGYLDTEVAAILADTAELQTDLANGGRLDLLIDAIKAKTDNLPAAPAATGDIPSAATVADAVWDEARSGHVSAGSFGEGVASVQGNVTGSVGSLATQAKADVNAEVLDVVNTDTFAEPGQEAPGATVSLAKKIGYVYKLARNKKTQSSTEFKVFADDGSTVDQKATVSDDGSVTTVGELGTGP